MRPGISTEKPWAIIQLKGRDFAIAAERLRQFTRMPDVASVPDLPSFVRGVINLSGAVLPLIDLRRRLGMTSATDEMESFCSLMEQRERDHRRWLDELRASIEEGRPFGLATDPHQCAFGRWYDGYRAEDPWVNGLLAKFDEPHKKIHSIAEQVGVLQERGDLAAASRVIDGTRAGALGVMIRLFAEFVRLVRERRRELVAVLMVGDRVIGVTIDAAVAVERMPVERLPGGMALDGDGLVKRVGRRGKTAQVVPIIETERILTPGAIANPLLLS